MGLNVNLVDMLGVPDKVICPQCYRVVPSGFDDYDIECGHPNPFPGEWALQCYCAHCEHTWKRFFHVRAEQ